MNSKKQKFLAFIALIVLVVAEFLEFSEDKFYETQHMQEIKFSLQVYLPVSGVVSTMSAHVVL